MISPAAAFGMLGVLAAAAPGLADAQGNRPRSLDTRVVVLPTPVATSAGSILGYELHITNVSSRDLTLVGLDIGRGFGQRGQSHSLRGDSLLSATVQVGRRDTTASVATLRSGRQIVVFLWEPAGDGTGQSVTLAHRLLVVPADSVSAVPDTVGPVLVSVPLRLAAAIAAPLEGGPWFARNGPSNGADHRRTLLAVGGVERIAQRFATDWIMLGPDYRLWHGDSTVNRNWYGYGVPVRAAGSGVIVAAYDGVPDNIPLASERAVPITLRERYPAAGLLPHDAVMLGLNIGGALVDPQLLQDRHQHRPEFGKLCLTGPDIHHPHLIRWAEAGMKETAARRRSTGGSETSDYFIILGRGPVLRQERDSQCHEGLRGVDRRNAGT